MLYLISLLLFSCWVVSNSCDPMECNLRLRPTSSSTESRMVELSWSWVHIHPLTQQAAWLLAIAAEAESMWVVTTSRWQQLPWVSFHEHYSTLEPEFDFWLVRPLALALTPHFVLLVQEDAQLVECSCDLELSLIFYPSLPHIWRIQDKDFQCHLWLSVI